LTRPPRQFRITPMLQIGPVSISRPVVLAALAGVSDLSFRTLNRAFGCEFAFTEMVNARSLCENNRHTHQLLATHAADRPLAIQLFGNDPDYLELAVNRLNDRGFALIDFNAACPQRKVVKDGKGAALLRDLPLLQSLLRVMVRAARVPVTVKIRLGWGTASGAENIARAVEDAGVAAVIVHGRTQAQGYSGVVNYDAIERVKKAVRVPVIASGDIFSGELARLMMERTGVDAVAVARGAFGNPWIFRQIYAALAGEPLPRQPAGVEIADTMREHLGMCVDARGERTAVVDFRKFYIWYTKGFTGVKQLRCRISQVATRPQMEEHIEAFRGIAQARERKVSCRKAMPQLVVEREVA